LHTNGYSLARRIFFEQLRLKPSSRLPGLRRSLGDELLRTHRNYQPLLAQVVVGKLKGLAHITGGGLVDNLPRVLPNDCDAVIATKSWNVPPIFQILQERGGIDRDEMCQVFNMGIGMAAIVSPNDSATIAKQLGAKVIGRIERGRGAVHLESRSPVNN
jgi:phosphoribosylformylglycinamidine cyclo-ligase